MAVVQIIYILISILSLYKFQNFNTQLLSSKVDSFLLSSPDQIIQKTDYACSAKLTQLLSEIPNYNLSVLKYIQQSGKGINDLGLYQQCNKDSQSRYILLELQVYPFNLFWGICGPLECTIESYSYLKTDLANIINLSIQSSGSQAVAPIATITEENVIFKDSLQQNARVRQIYPSTIFTLILTSLIVIFTILGTLFHILGYFHEDRRGGKQQALISQYESQQRKSSCLFRFLKSFSLKLNYRALCKPTTINSEDRTNVLNGVRVMSMGWVILGHSFFFMLQGPVTNLTKVREILSDGWFSIIETGTYSVDVFFLLSGFLATYIILARMHKKDGYSEGPHITILHRYIRLFPLYAYVMLCFVTLIPLLAYGPIFFLYSDQQMQACIQGWWTHFLYINNLLAYGKKQGADFCMGWTWYLPNDFQFYIVAALLVPLFYKKPYLSLGLIGLVTIVCQIVSVIVVLKYSISLSLMKFNQNGFPKYYNKPYTRVSPFIVGIIAGMMYYQHSISTVRSQKRGIFTDKQPIQREKPIEGVKCFDKINLLVKHSSLFRWISYTIGFITIQLIVLAHYSLNSYTDSWNKLQDTLFVLISRPLFTIALMALIYPAMLGHGSWIYNILGWKGWTPFAKVTYGAYLIHPLYMQLVSYNTQGGLYISGPICVFLFIPYTVLVFGSAIILHLFVEAPFANLEKEFIQPALLCKCCRKKRMMTIIKNNKFESVQEDSLEGISYNENYQEGGNKFQNLRKQEQSLGVA